jgi:hypothetical protein
MNITEKEHKRIYAIVDEFGGDKKAVLRLKIIHLMRGRDKLVISEVEKSINKLRD